MVEETGDCLQALVGGDDREIGAADDRGTAFGRELPREADAIVMRVGIARPTESMSRETFVNAADHRVDFSLAVALHYRIEIARVFRAIRARRRDSSVSFHIAIYRSINSFRFSIRGSIFNASLRCLRS